MEHNLKITQRNSGKNVLLLHAPFNKYAFGNEWKEKKSLSPPLGLLYLGYPLISGGYDVSFLDLNVDRLEKDEFIEIIKSQDFILMTCFDGTIQNVKKIIRDIREVNAKGNILCGGPYCNENREHIDGSNITCVGEAEGYITKILDFIILKKSLRSIPGLIYKENGKIVKNSGIMKVDELDSSMPPARELVVIKKYGYIGITRLDIALIMSSRGCPFNCYFCSSSLYSKYRKRSVDNVVTEIKSLVKQGYNYITFGDDNFLQNKKRAMKIMDRIIKEKMKVKLIILGRVDSADYRLYKKLRDAGVIAILYGIESANQDVLDFYNKRTTVQKGIEAIKLANKVGIITFGSFIIGAPFEREQHFNKNKEYFDSVNLDLMICNKLVYIKGSKLWNDAYKEGLIKESEVNVMTNKRLSNYSSKELSAIKNELTRYFYKNRWRLLRLLYKVIRLGEGKLIIKILIDAKAIRGRLNATLMDL